MVELKRKTQINFGRPSYINALPFFSGLEAEGNDFDLKFFDAPPSQLNQLIQNGETDVTLASSIEYARNPDKYFVLPGLGLSAKEDCLSVNLFCEEELTSLNKKQIFYTSETASSIVLLDILLKDCFELQVELVSLGEQDEAEAISEGKPCLVIGDKALLLNHRLKDTNVRCYDLASLWWAWMKSPFCFALWLVRKDYYNENKESVQALSHQMRERVSKNCLDFESLRIKHEKFSPTLHGLSEQEVKEYLALFDFGLNEKTVQGLHIFYEKAHRLGIIPQIKKLEFAS